MRQIWQRKIMTVLFITRSPSWSQHRSIAGFGIAAIPGSSFYGSTLGSHQARFAFGKRPETLAVAAERLNKLTPRCSHVRRRLKPWLYRLPRYGRHSCSMKFL
jgi:hypothetical protein